MIGFGAPTPPAGGSGSGGPAVDETARAAAAAAQAAADGNAEAITKIASRIRIFNMVTHSLGTTALKEMFYASYLADATGVFADIDPLVDDISRVTIPAGVSRVAVSMGSRPSTGSNSPRAQRVRLYDAEEELKLDLIASASAPSATGTSSLYGREIVKVEAGDYLVPFVQTSAVAGTLDTPGGGQRSANYLLVEVLE